MRLQDHVQYAERLERHPNGDRHREDVGPQGAALILELRRLQHAFEHDLATDPNAPSRRAARERARAPEPQRRRPPKRPKKGGMGRVIESWLEPFRSAAAEPDRRRSEPTLSAKAAPPRTAPPKQRQRGSAASRRRRTAQPQRQRSTVLTGGSIPMDLSAGACHSGARSQATACHRQCCRLAGLPRGAGAWATEW